MRVGREKNGFEEERCVKESVDERGMWIERIALERESGVRMLNERRIGVGNREVRERERKTERLCVDERGGWVLGGRGEIDG